jgi:hypothetical protein
MESPSSEDLLALTKEKIMKCKIIGLEKMNLPVLTNPKYVTKRQKDELISIVEKLMECDDESITKQFNEIVNDKLLSGNQDISKYPIYSN